MYNVGDEVVLPDANTLYAKTGLMRSSCRGNEYKKTRVVEASENRIKVKTRKGSEFWINKEYVQSLGLQKIQQESQVY